MNFPLKQNSGFTLIELLVVIAIIGLLSSIVLASLATAKYRAYDAERESDFNTIKTALVEYANDHNGLYPATSGWYTQCVGFPGIIQEPANNVIPGMVPTYLPSMPADPGMVASANQNCYLYYSNGTDYKFLDYNQTSIVNTGSQLTLIDPARNYNRGYSPEWQVPEVNNPCSSDGWTDSTTVWAIWSSAASECW